jgi:hypothetical protein
MQITTLSFQKSKRLSVVQFSSLSKNTFDYISADIAMKSNFIEVKEISKEGEVNTLFLINHSEKFVFLMDGDILQGAKQNRVLNTSVLVAPNSKINLPVSCVEQGRWNYVSNKFDTSEYISPQKLRAKKAESVKESLRSKRKYFADQGEVWDDVSDYSMVYNVASPSMNLSDVFENKKKDFEEFIKNFSVNTDANGLAVFTDKNLLSIDLFNRTDIYQEYFPKILRSTAMEVFHLKDKENLITEAEAIFKTVDLFDNLEKIEHKIHPGVGVGKEKRFDSEKLTGFELDYQNHLIHLTLLRLDEDSNENKSIRRRLRVF